MAATDRIVQLSLPDSLYAVLMEAARRANRTPDDLAAEMLAEAAKMRQVPGIEFADGASGRVARVGGTGLDVWEIVAEYRTVDEDWKRLRASYSWLSEHQLRAALAYAAVYPQEIEERLQREADWTPEAVWSAHPFMRPPGPVVRFYLDEDLSDEVARIARAQGLDVVSSHECGRDGLSDDAQLRLAAEDGRCLVTRNRDDFIRWTVRFYENDWPHAGVLIVTRTLQHRTAAAIAAGLLAYAQHHEHDLPSYATDFLSPAP